MRPADGSPLSNVFSCPYTAAINERLSQIRSFGYAFDIVIFFSEPALADTALQAIYAIDTLQESGKANAVTFEIKKTEITQFIGGFTVLLIYLMTRTP